MSSSRRESHSPWRGYTSPRPSFRSRQAALISRAREAHSLASHPAPGAIGSNVGDEETPSHD